MNAIVLNGNVLRTFFLRLWWFKDLSYHPV